MGRELDSPEDESRRGRIDPAVQVVESHLGQLM
jgi:hypothetical protein